MWMIKHLVGWCAVLAFCIMTLNFWRTYAYAKADTGDSGMLNAISAGSSYFIEVGQDLDQMKRDNAIVQYIIPGVVDDTKPKSFFGRIIARPGDRVEMVNGMLRVNGLDVPKLGHIYGLSDPADPKFNKPTQYDFDSILVGRGKNYIAVDHWKADENSFSLTFFDSRKIGLVPDEHIIGMKSQLDVAKFGMQLGFVVALILGYVFVDRFIS